MMAPIVVEIKYAMQRCQRRQCALLLWLLLVLALRRSRLVRRLLLRRRLRVQLGLDGGEGLVLDDADVGGRLRCVEQSDCDVRFAEGVCRRFFFMLSAMRTVSSNSSSSSKAGLRSGMATDAGASAWESRAGMSGISGWNGSIIFCSD